MSLTSGLASPTFVTEPQSEYLNYDTPSSSNFYDSAGRFFSTAQMGRFMSAFFSPAEFRKRNREGQRVIFTWLPPEPFCDRSALASIDLIDQFDDWQLVHLTPRAHAIICPSKDERVLLYFPKSTLDVHVRCRQFQGGHWRIDAPFSLPVNLCRILGIPVGSQIASGQYIPTDLSGHLVFRLRVTKLIIP